MIWNNTWLASVFDKVSKPKLYRFTAQYSSCNLQNAIFFRKSKTVQKRKEQVRYFLDQLVRKWSVSVPNFTESL